MKSVLFTSVVLFVICIQTNYLSAQSSDEPAPYTDRYVTYTYTASDQNVCLYGGETCHGVGFSLEDDGSYSVTEINEHDGMCGFGMHVGSGHGDRMQYSLIEGMWTQLITLVRADADGNGSIIYFNSISSPTSTVHEIVEVPGWRRLPSQFSLPGGMGISISGSYIYMRDISADLQQQIDISCCGASPDSLMVVTNDIGMVIAIISLLGENLHGPILVLMPDGQTVTWGQCCMNSCVTGTLQLPISI